MITTDSKSVLIGSRGVDRLGRAGLDGQIDYRFDLKFEAAFFVSVITRIADAAQTSGTSSVSSDPGVDALRNEGDSVLSEYLAIPPSIHVQHGTPVNVFVAKDLYF